MNDKKYSDVFEIKKIIKSFQMNTKFISEQERFMRKHYKGYNILEEQFGYESLSDIGLLQLDTVNSLPNKTMSFDFAERPKTNSYECFEKPENYMYVNWFRMELTGDNISMNVDVILIQEDGYDWVFDTYYFMSNTTSIFCIYNDECLQWLKFDQSINQNFNFIGKQHKTNEQNREKMQHINSLSHDLLIRHTDFFEKKTQK